MTTQVTKEIERWRGVDRRIEGSATRNGGRNASQRQATREKNSSGEGRLVGRQMKLASETDFILPTATAGH